MTCHDMLATQHPRDPARAPDKAGGGATVQGGQKARYAHYVFMSYAHEDSKDVAARLEEGLTLRGLRVWRDEIHLSAGDTIHDEIKRGLASSSHMVAVITPAYLKKAPPLMELGTVVSGNHGGRIIPVLHVIRHLDMERKLSALAGRYMKTWDGGSEQFIDEIARVVGECQGGQAASTSSITTCCRHRRAHADMVGTRASGAYGGDTQAAATARRLSGTRGGAPCARRRESRPALARRASLRSCALTHPCAGHLFTYPPSAGFPVRRRDISGEEAGAD